MCLLNYETAYLGYEQRDPDLAMGLELLLLRSAQTLNLNRRFQLVQ